MKNKLVDLVKISALAVVVASASSSAFAQVGGAAPQIAPAPRPSTGFVAPQLQLSTAQGRAFEASAYTSVGRLGLPVEKASALAKSVGEAMAAKERQLKASGQPVTVSALRNAFTAAITSGVAKEANAAGKVAVAQSNLDALMASTTTSEAAKAVVEGQVAKATSASNVAPVACDLTESTRAGITGPEGMVSRDGDLLTAAQIESLRAEGLALQKQIQDRVGLGNYTTVTVSNFTNVNGVPVSSKVLGPVAAFDQFTAAASKDGSSIDVLTGAVTFLRIRVSVLNGIGKDVTNPATLWAMDVSALVNKLTPSVGKAAALDIGYGVLIDANKDGTVDAADQGKREGGIYEHCRVPLAGVAA